MAAKLLQRDDLQERLLQQIFSVKGLATWVGISGPIGGGCIFLQVVQVQFVFIFLLT